MNEYSITGRSFSFRSSLWEDINELVDFIYQMQSIDSKEDAYILIRGMRDKIHHIEAEIKKPGTAYMLEDAP